jgi:hypothetical protein
MLSQHIYKVNCWFKSDNPHAFNIGSALQYFMVYGSIPLLYSQATFDTFKLIIQGKNTQKQLQKELGGLSHATIAERLSVLSKNKYVGFSEKGRQKTYFINWKGLYGAYVAFFKDRDVFKTKSQNIPAPTQADLEFFAKTVGYTLLMEKLVNFSELFLFLMHYVPITSKDGK